MKKMSLKLLVSLFIVALFSTQMSSVMAQDDQIKTEFEIIQDAFGLQKKDIIATFISLEGVDGDAFWKVYNEYEAKRKELGKVRLELLYNYTMEVGMVTNEEADALMKKVIPMRRSYDKLIIDYYAKMKKATNPIVAAQFYQIENYISTGIRFTILDSMDFIMGK